MIPVPSIDSPWLTRREAAKYLKCSESRLAHLAGAGKGPAFHRAPKSKIVRYHVAALDAFLGAPLTSTTERSARDRARSAA
jgi:hypothetical protein